MKRLMNVGLGVLSVAVLGTGSGLAEERVEGPEGLVGFSGQVRGVVAGKGERNTVMFKVGRLIRVWEGNKASNPEALVGRTVPVAPRWQQGDGGSWRPVERHVRFLQSLQPGEELTLEIRHAEREHFAILELSQEQRERAGAGGDRREGGEREGRERAEGREGGEREQAERRERAGDREGAAREGGDRPQREMREGGDRPQREMREGREQRGEEARRGREGEIEELRRRIEQLEEENRRLRESR